MPLLPYPSIKQLPSSAHHVRESAAVLAFHLTVSMFILLCTTGIIGTLLILSSEGIFGGYLNTLTPTINAVIFLISITIVFAIGWFSIIIIALQWVSKEYFMTETHLICYAGIFSLTENIYELQHIKSVKLRQSMWGKIFHYGDVTVSFAASGYNETLVCKNIADPKIYERILKNAVKK